MWRAGVLACSELFTRPGSAGKMPAGPTAKMARYATCAMRWRSSHSLQMLLMRVST